MSAAEFLPGCGVFVVLIFSFICVSVKGFV